MIIWRVVKNRRTKAKGIASRGAEVAVARSFGGRRLRRNLRRQPVNRQASLPRQKFELGPRITGRAAACVFLS